MTQPAWGARLQAVFELTPTILTVTGLDDGRIVEVNDAFLLATGYSRDEVIGRSVPEIAVWVDPAQRDEGLAALRAGRSIRNVEARFRTKSGREIVAITNADVIDIDGRACILTALIDITDRVRAESALRESERRFAQLFHANPLPMTIVSMRTHRHLDANEAAVRHSGYTRDEMLGRTKPELGFWVAPDQRDGLLHQLLARGQVRDFEVTFRTKSGEERASARSCARRSGARPGAGEAARRAPRRLRVGDQSRSGPRKRVQRGAAGPRRAYRVDAFQ
jgi:PAS domain S-box-containing protein